MNTVKLTGVRLFGNILAPKSYDSVSGGFKEDPRGTYQLTLIVDEDSLDYRLFTTAVEAKIAEIKAGDKYKKLVAEGKTVTFSYKDKPHTDKDKNLVAGKRQVSMKRNAINGAGKVAHIDIFNRFYEPYAPENEPSGGTTMQSALGIGDAFIPKDNIWYITFYLLAVMIMGEAQTSYGFEPEVRDFYPDTATEAVTKAFPEAKVVEEPEDDMPF